jgi:outer membrane protein TolC
MTSTNLKLVFIALIVVAGAAITQTAAQTATTRIDLPNAVRQAFTRGPDLASAQATLTNARADLASKESDPSTLIVPLTQARNTVILNAAQLEGQKLTVMANVMTAYLNVFEAQENFKILEAQVALDTRNLDVARARLAARNGTQLDVSRAENALSGSRQSLVDARANLPILSNRLEPLLGLPLNANLTVANPPAFKEVKIDAAALENNLEKRLASVLQVAQSVELAELNVRLSDNDYTPPATLRDAKVSLENAQRNLDTVKKNALTGLRDAVRAVANALERVRIADRDLDNAEASLKQDQTRFNNGTISRLALQTTEVTTLRSRFAYTQATNAYWRALAQLSTASGLDQTGLVAQ